MRYQRLLGAWRLLSHTRRDEKGKISHPLGRRPLGYLIYSPKGFMSVCMMSRNRFQLRTPDFKNASSHQKARAAETYMSYAGKYELRKDKVIHHVEVSLIPSWVGRKFPRKIGWIEDRLSLCSPPFLLNGKKHTTHVLWERVE
ncbi:MAG: lipocalin-like domain-containing protein [Elusimicrobia bacterium]|nr:lipocalin-like domain-containing protein [Elusimicrobiota bacterium]